MGKKDAGGKGLLPIRVPCSLHSNTTQRQTCQCRRRCPASGDGVTLRRLRGLCVTSWFLLLLLLRKSCWPGSDNMSVVQIAKEGRCSTHQSVPLAS